MTIAEYLASIKERLLVDPIVSHFSILRERATSLDGHLRVRLALTDGSRLEFSEYVQRGMDGRIAVATYSHHWADSEGRLIKRWDNTPHHPGLAGFPHHIHDGASGSVEPGNPTHIFAVLDEISASMR